MQNSLWEAVSTSRVVLQQKYVWIQYTRTLCVVLLRKLHHQPHKMICCGSRVSQGIAIYPPSDEVETFSQTGIVWREVVVTCQMVRKQCR